MNENGINANKLRKFNRISFVIGLASSLFRILLIIVLISNLIGLAIIKDKDKKQIFKSGIIGCVIGFLATSLIIFISALIR